ncbi:polysaccharide pyruvyl transferase family protein [Clostridium perfringens]|uniref:polysaccharide pyruvyl transferase family protein n=1 Tax=Clostridium perfringens TaxID=1502 RepID=UPI0018E49988|nr:polysaccharide pyruvyl transferase family protein [Clostridium perfringens]MBI6004193.1 polysaccharide pyruvyl transferase family protein [Clostridium perfringens]
MKKITITNGYTWYNKGDAGILLGTVNAIKEIFGENIEINILSFTPDEDKKRYCKDSIIKDVYSNVLNPYPFKKTFWGKKLAILKLFTNISINYLNINLLKDRFVENNENIKILKESDLIVVCGGGFLGGKKFNSFMHLYQMYINSKFDKPVILWGTSIEPFKNNIVKYFTEKQLNNLTHIFPRETITYDYLKESDIKEDKFTIIPDMAFMLENKDEKFEFINKLRDEFDCLFGLTVREWSFPNVENAGKAKENYINAICETIIEFSEEKNAVFIFIPQVIFEGDDDSIVANEIRDRLPKKYKKHFIINKEDWSPVQIKSIIGNFDMFVGTRMHSNIFATSMAVPTVAIAYEKKTNGIMETVGLSDYIVEIDTITSKELIDKINKCYKNREFIHQSLEKRILEVREEILNKSEFIKEL